MGCKDPSPYEKPLSSLATPIDFPGIVNAAPVNPCTHSLYVLQYPLRPYTHHPENPAIPFLPLYTSPFCILLNGPLIPFKELFYLHVSVMSLSPHERSQETKKYFVFNTLSSIFIGYILSRFKYIRKLKPCKKKCIHGLDGACSFFFFSHVLVFSFLLFFSIFIMYLLSSIFFVF